MSCELVRTRGETFLDGELPANQMLELQGHVDGCPDCRAQLAFCTTIRETTRQVEVDSTQITPEFEQRMLQVLRSEAEQESSVVASTTLSVENSGGGTRQTRSSRVLPRLVRGRFGPPVMTFTATAAAAYLFFGGQQTPDLEPPVVAAVGQVTPSPPIARSEKTQAETPSESQARRAKPSVAQSNVLKSNRAERAIARPALLRSANLTPTNLRQADIRPANFRPTDLKPAKAKPQIKSKVKPRLVRNTVSERSRIATTDELLDRLVELHTAPPKNQVTELRNVAQLTRDIGVTVDFPRRMEAQYGAHFEGGSVVRMRNNQLAAQLRYHTRDGSNFTVYVYDPKRLPLHAGLLPSRLYDEPVYVGRRRGYSIAASKQYGVGYAVTGDLNTQQSAQLIRTIAYGGEPKRRR